MLKARHGGAGRIELDQPDPILRLAGDTGLDVDRLRDDLGDPEVLSAVARDHTEAVEEYGAFGTPTFIFEDGSSAYLKSFIPPPEDSVSFFKDFMGIMANRPYVGEIKRPQPPWPKGAVK